MSPEGLLGRTRRLWYLVSALILGIALGCSPSALAASIVQIGGNSGTSLNGLGSFSGSISYSTDSALSTTGTLIIALTNTTSNSANGGFITGLAFNIGGSDSSSSATLATASNGFTNCVGGGLDDGQGHLFEGGAGVGGSFLGAGSPNPAIPGIAVGQTAYFTFDITAADAGLLTAMDFLTGGSFDFNFLVRFSGFEDGGPDNVGAIVVPLPPALPIGLLGLALAGAATYARHRTSDARKHADGREQSIAADSTPARSSCASPRA